MSKNYIVNCYTCQHNGQETCKGCNTLLVGEDEPYQNWQLREDLEQKDKKIADLQSQLKDNNKQVCEKIRKFAYDTYKEFGVFDEVDLEYILDQIQGETK